MTKYVEDGTGGSAALLLLLDAPVREAPPSRLLPDLDPEQAVELHKAMVEDLLDRTDDPGWDRLLLPSQTGEDPGARLTDAFRHAFARGYMRVAAAVGTAPALDAAAVRRAFAALGEHPVAVIPAPDGGYSLIALNRETPELFREIAWGTPAVFTQTLLRVADLGLSMKVLPPLPDIETASDLLRLWKESGRGASGHSPRTAAFLRKLLGRS